MGCLNYEFGAIGRISKRLPCKATEGRAQVLPTRQRIVSNQGSAILKNPGKKIGKERKEPNS